MNPLTEHVDPALDFGLDIHIHASEDDAGVLNRFNACFFIYDDDQTVGRLTGWIGWRVLDEDLADAADEISADSSHIGYVAAQLLKDQDDSWIEDVVLLDRVWIAPEFRQRGLLGELIDRLIRELRLHIDDCFVVTEPEPQQESGGPYPDGPQRDKAMNGLLRSLSNAGFAAWKDSVVFWRRAERP